MAAHIDKSDQASLLFENGIFIQYLITLARTTWDDSTPALHELVMRQVRIKVMEDSPNKFRRLEAIEGVFMEQEEGSVRC